MALVSTWKRRRSEKEMYTVHLQKLIQRPACILNDKNTKKGTTMFAIVFIGTARCGGRTRNLEIAYS